MADTKMSAGQAILASNKNDDQKLYEIFLLHQNEIRKQNINLYYALLGWKDAHIRELDSSMVSNVCGASAYFSEK